MRHQLVSLQVLFRFMFRVVLLGLFAAIGTQGLGSPFNVLLGLASIFCVIVGAMRHDGMFGPVLTHWDEAAAYTGIGCLVSVLS
jgi:hypothetical protein